MAIISVLTKKGTLFTFEVKETPSAIWNLLGADPNLDAIINSRNYTFIRLTDLRGLPHIFNIRFIFSIEAENA